MGNLPIEIIWENIVLFCEFVNESSIDTLDKGVFPDQFKKCRC